MPYLRDNANLALRGQSFIAVVVGHGEIAVSGRSARRDKAGSRNGRTLGRAGKVVIELAVVGRGDELAVVHDEPRLNLCRAGLLDGNHAAHRRKNAADRISARIRDVDVVGKVGRVTIAALGIDRVGIKRNRLSRHGGGIVRRLVADDASVAAGYRAKTE